MVALSIASGAFGKDNDGNAVTGLTYDFSEISYSVGDSGSNSFTFDLDGWAGATLDFSGSFLFEVGLTGEVHVDLGHLDTTLDIDTDGFVVNGVSGGAASLDTSGFTIDAFEVDPVGFDLAESYIELGFRAALEANVTSTLSGYYDVGLESLGLEGRFNMQLFENQNIAVEFLQELIPHTAFDTLGGLDGNIFKLGIGDFVEVSVDIPEFEYKEPEYTENDGGIDSVHIEGMSSPFLSLEIGIASFILPAGIGPIGFDLSDILGETLSEYFNIEVEGGLFDAKLVGTVSIGQDINIESEVSADLVTSLGETLSGSLGDEFVFVTPEGEGTFTVDASYTLSQTVEAVTSVVLNSQIDWRALFLQFEASVDVGVYSDTFEEEFALFKESVDLGDLLGLTASFELYNDITTYLSDAGEETYTIAYENFVTSASGAALTLTTNQDTVIGGDIDNTITGNVLNNVLRGQAGDDAILGGDGDDRLFGGVGVDDLFGGDGDDRLFGGVGADDIFGGDGFDIVNYERSRKGVSVDLEESVGSGAQALGAQASGDSLDGIEGLCGSDFGDALSGDDNANLLSGGLGNDRLNGRGGNDALLGGAGADTINGGNGVDTLRFGQSSVGVSVNLATGAGLNGEAAGDVYTEIENVTGTNGDDVIVGSNGDNRLRGGNGADSISGGAGNDVLKGGKGVDTLQGGDGVDTIVFLNAESGAVAVDIQKNFVHAVGVDEGNDIISGFENIIGSDFGDYLAGNKGANILNGGDGADVMYGRGGDDTFGLGGGNDTVHGGDGFDELTISGNRSDYSVEMDATFERFIITKLTGDLETYQVNSVENIVFADTEYALDWFILPF